MTATTTFIIDESTKKKVRQRLPTYNTGDVCTISGLTGHQLMQVSYGFLNLPEETLSSSLPAASVLSEASQDGHANWRRHYLHGLPQL